ncbi:MAG: flagellar basal body P-ring protein FlgI [Rhizobiaceae bacterium]|nr:flagellar basal body P-ring protein FlgI [Hyphomicrobiales bacterium]NRB30535.1 flagellar basal body P-ring protein FlgI [Rhizobiaceae bacterium]
MRALLLLLILSLAPWPAFSASRLKDIASLQISRENMLVGYGLVVGLQGTGDGLRNAPFTEQSLKAMLSRLGIASGDRAARSKNLAAVIVTAKLPVFASPGARLDVTVSSIGDATSLAGGTLVMTPLRGADLETYAAAQGPVVVSGFQAEGQAETVTQGVPTTGRIPNGAVVEQGLSDQLEDFGVMDLQLRNPDFSTAVRVTDMINEYTKRKYGAVTAKERDSSTITLKKPQHVSTARFVAEIESLRVETDSVARVVLDERTGTVVIGANVKVSKVAVSHGTLSVRVSELPKVVQPNPFANGDTAVEPSTEITAVQEGGQIATVDGTDLQELISGLNQLGVKPTDIIAILQAIKSAGALQAELVLQ